MLTLDRLFGIVYSETNMNDKDLLKIDEVAIVLGVSRATVYEFINDSENPLPVIYLSDRSPRIKSEELKVWIDRQAEIQKNKTTSNKDKNSNQEGGEQ